jgi:hypothetical protein
MVVLAAAPAGALAAAPAKSQAQTSQARLFGRSFARRTPAFGSRYRYRTRSPYTRAYRRPHLWRGFFGGVLKALGIAYLFHLLFGFGPGGSPFGLLLLVALVAWLLGRRTRRPAAPYPY